MTRRPWLRTVRLAGLAAVVAAGLVAGNMGGCKCGRDVAAGGDSEDEPPPLSEEDPDAPRPNTHYARGVRVDEASVNEFVEKMLRICEKGDYDGFHELFGIAINPPDGKDFERVWKNVRDIQVEGFVKGNPEPPKYYVYGLVQYRKPDRKGRIERPVVLELFQEEGEWRMGPAPDDIVRRILIARTQPAAGTNDTP